MTKNADKGYWIHSKKKLVKFENAKIFNGNISVITI